MNPELIDTLVVDNTTTIVFVILDGLGGLPHPDTGRTELETAVTPNLDRLAQQSVCGLLDPIGYGITPGSGPAHFALFGYDPVIHNVGRGLLTAAGIEFPMKEGDLYARVNFATADEKGMITDRRAGRIDTETCARLCRRLNEHLSGTGGVDVLFVPEKEHRALLVLRGDNLREEITDTDPELTGKPPHVPRATVPEAEATRRLIEVVAARACSVLSPELRANTILLRGFARFREYRTFEKRFRLKALAIANYPMYRGIARLLGMAVHPVTASVRDQFGSLGENFRRHQFFFLHVKATDARGEDGNFDGKVKVIEEIDSLMPEVAALKPDVLVVTGDHSTPAVMASHSWHPVPVLLSSALCRPDGVMHFGEGDCIAGGLGRLPMMYLMGLALAHARRLSKFGA
jgi:2,3-bisphosphoglycerate-independent phosphoglycerate mutase